MTAILPHRSTSESLHEVVLAAQASDLHMQSSNGELTSLF